MIFILSLLWVLTCGISDYQTRKVPNWLIAIGLVGAILLQIRHWDNDMMHAGNIVLIIGFWAYFVAIWFMGWWGGADAKFSMVLLLAFPDMTLAITMFVAHAGAVLTTYIAKRRSNDIKELSPRITLPLVTYFAAGWIAWAARVYLVQS